jgi:hypothetical protein
MITSVKSSPTLWLLDQDPGLLSLLDRAARVAVGSVTICSDVHPRDTLDRLDSLPAVDGPTVFVSDSIGFVSKNTNKHSPAEQLRRQFPLTLIVLHSNSAYNDELTVSNLRARKLIDHDVRKTILSAEFGALLKRWFDRANGDVPRKLREYLKSCPNPECEYLWDADHGKLSLQHIYRHIVLGTELGLEQEKVWELLLAEQAR